MDEANLSQQVRDTIASHSDERLLSMLEAPEGQFTAEALEYARAELRTRGGEALVAQRVRERPESPDRLVAEYPSDDDILTSAFNGCGTAFYGKRDREPDG